MTSWITRLISKQFRLLLSNISSVLEGALITLELWILGLVLGPAWAINEIWTSRTWDVKFTMFEKLAALFKLFRVGEEIANPGKWKAGQIQATLVTGLVLAVINVADKFGYHLGVSASDANAVGAGVVAVVNILLSATTSARAGLLPAATSEPAGASDPSQPAPVPGASAPVSTAGQQPVDSPAAEAARADQYRA